MGSGSGVGVARVTAARARVKTTAMKRMTYIFKTKMKDKEDGWGRGLTRYIDSQSVYLPSLGLKWWWGACINGTYLVLYSMNGIKLFKASGIMSITWSQPIVESWYEPKYKNVRLDQCSFLNLSVSIALSIYAYLEEHGRCRWEQPEVYANSLQCLIDVIWLVWELEPQISPVSIMHY